MLDTKFTKYLLPCNKHFVLVGAEKLSWHIPPKHMDLINTTINMNTQRFVAAYNRKPGNIDNTKSMRRIFIYHSI